MNTFSIQGAFSKAWELFKKRPLFFIGVVVIESVLPQLVSMIAARSHDEMVQNILVIPQLLLSMFLALGATVVMLRAYDSIDTVDFSGFMQFEKFLPYLGLTFLVSIAVLGGFILLIIPGIILSLMFWSAPYILIDQNTGVIESIKESMRITRGHKWQILLFWLANAGVGLLGFLALGVGIFVAIPVIALATVHVYRELVRMAAESTPVAGPSTADTPSA